MTITITIAKRINYNRFNKIYNYKEYLYIHN